MSDLSERLRSWAQNEEMVDEFYTKHGHDCLEAADIIERLQALVDKVEDVCSRYDIPDLETFLRVANGEPFSLERLLEDSGFHRNLDDEP